MPKIFLLLALFVPVVCFGGIETILVQERQGDCTARVLHDATPTSKIGTIDFRSYKVIDGLHHPCGLTKSQVKESLGRGLAKYVSDKNLKPATSIMVGRISRYPWVQSAWQARSQTGSYKKLSIAEFNALVSSRPISEPFAEALQSNGLEFGGASCEKIQFYSNGWPMDALCWFKIK